MPYFATNLSPNSKHFLRYYNRAKFQFGIAHYTKLKFGVGSARLFGYRRAMLGHGKIKISPAIAKPKTNNQKKADKKNSQSSTFMQGTPPLKIPKTTPPKKSLGGSHLRYFTSRAVPFLKVLPL